METTVLSKDLACYWRICKSRRCKKYGL